LCGEWDTSQATSAQSGERYNAELPVLEIVRHPDFDPSKGPINGNDIAVFKVNDFHISSDLELWPACLPEKSVIAKSGIHTGWSTPPSFSFIKSQGPGFARHYNDFFKQWHYKMDVFDLCEDPKESGHCFAGALDFPSNSSYPAGTICAKDVTRLSCFSTGDSGSPLMVRDDRDRFSIQGILSFVKGCDRFEFGRRNENRTSILRQQSENPSTYTKLSCFLPWIASEYNMRYENSDMEEPSCSRGTGDPDDGNNQCRNTISNTFEYLENLEIECKFPFYYEGKLYDECILLDEEGFLYPIFRCPIRDITTKIDGINSFEFTGLVQGICLSNFSDKLGPLDPMKDCESRSERRFPFSQCKNNCPGVRAFGIIGGGAVLGGIAAASVLSTLPLLGTAGIGAMGLVGAGSFAMCSPPFFCNTPSGCCLVAFSVNGAVCPDTC